MGSQTDPDDAAPQVGAWVDRLGGEEEAWRPRGAHHREHRSSDGVEWRKDGRGGSGGRGHAMGGGAPNVDVIVKIRVTTGGGSLRPNGRTRTPPSTKKLMDASAIWGK